ncbi:MAG TPA: TonB family protein [Verrucomicrobiae bacterium]|nr:TonB family protein [Verrucomicrobiae bacterium]
MQKKCLFAAAGAHLLVIVVLLCSAFTSPKPPQDDTPVLTLVNLTDGPTTGSKSDPTPPPPTPPVTQPPEPIPLPPTPPVPVPDPPKQVVEPVKQVEPVKPPEEVKPVENPEIKIPPTKPKVKPKPKIDMSVVKVDPKKMADHAAETAAAAAAQAKADAKQRDQQRKAFKAAMSSIKNNASSSTDVEMPGTSSVSFANYASVVKSKYEGAWIEPDNADNDEAIVKVSVTIANDGHVTASSIVNASGDSKVDRSVQRTLDRVDFVAPFPDGAKEKERTFIINFNLKAKRLNG